MQYAYIVGKYKIYLHSLRNRPKKLVLLFPLDIVFNVCELPDGNFLNLSQYYTYLNIPLRMPPFLSLGFFFFDFL
jgi:hypothetical protein